MAGQNSYHHLEAIFHKAALLGDTLSLLHWDMATMMPEGAAFGRAEQVAQLKTMAHGMITAPNVPDLLEGAAAEDLDPWQRANLREMRRDWVHAAALPTDLVEAVAKAESACEMAWRQARPMANFTAVRPVLAELLSLVCQQAQAKAEKLGVGLYDALLDQYEPDGRSSEIDAVFADLEGFLPDFLGAVLEKQASLPASALPPGPFPQDRQRAVALDFMTSLGFDFNHGRLDTSLHPFCGGTADDVRITTRYDEADFTSAMMGVLHETGHALYEMGLPGGVWRHQPVGRARGMALHESQSLLMEMQACRSPAFMGWAAPKLAAAFGGDGAHWSAEALSRQALNVEPGFIRVDADEVTYPSHVILRYRLEKALIEGRMDLVDLPEAWNDGTRRLLGISPPDDRLGCLQDIHWYGGAWGYFPTYTLGAMTAAQLFDAARSKDPGILPAIGKGDFQPLLAWLRANVHSQGSLLSTRDLLIQATGKPLDAEVFKTHLRERYLG